MGHKVKRNLDEQYSDTKQVVLVCDNMNNHNIASLYESFELAESIWLAKQIDMHHIPKHGSCLHIEEIGLSALGNQCLSKCRIGDIGK